MMNEPVFNVDSVIVTQPGEPHRFPLPSSVPYHCFDSDQGRRQLNDRACSP